jgi:hypothetical protein
MGELSVIDAESTSTSSRSLVGKLPQPSVPVVARLLATMHDGEYEKNWQKLQVLAVMMKCLMGQLMGGDACRLAAYAVEDRAKELADPEVVEEMLNWFKTELNDSHRRNPFAKAGFV